VRATSGERHVIARLSRWVMDSRANPWKETGCAGSFSRDFFEPNGVVDSRPSLPPMPEAGTPVRLRFGVFEVDLRAGELRKHGVRRRLQEQPFQVLAMLLERPGETVTRDELRNRLWTADTFVDFDQGVNKAVNRIRDALGDSATSPRFVETVARRGYRFIADVSAVESAPVAKADARSVDVAAPGNEPIAALAAPPSPGHLRRWYLWAIAGAGLAVASIAIAVWALQPRTPPPIRSLAVLPLENLSGDAAQEYFADGMTDELIAVLGQISALRVISRTSVMPYKRARKPLPQIARELNVDAVIEGTVLRSGGQVRITAQLIAARDDTHVWSDTYDGDLRDTLMLQNKVARAIAEQIRVNLKPQEQATLKHGKVVDPQAYEAYLKGRYFWNKRTSSDFQKAIEYFTRATERDPAYAQAYSGLADTYALLGDWDYGVLAPRDAFPRAKAAALKALQLDSMVGDAHTSLAFSLDGFDWDFISADNEFRRAIELNPGYATAHHWYAWHLSLLGRNDNAIAEMKRAQNLDPLSLIINADLAELLLIARLTDESIQQSRKTIELDPNFPLAHNQLGLAYLQRQRSDDAIAELRKAVQLSAGSATCTANLARAFAVSGRRNEAVQLLETLKKRATDTYSNAPEIAVVYAALGDADQAMAWLERGYGERFNPGVLLRPGFDALRADRRFQALERRVGLSR
jgi:TolB-like protein/DNA-binding winged helix-turn-helix (wHTH) protein/Tfp pilus assembly protein PilF